MFVAMWTRIIHFKQNCLNYATFSVIMSKIKNRSRITQCDHIASFNRGHPGGVHFTLLAYYTGRWGWVVLPLRHKSLTDIKFQISSQCVTNIWPTFRWSSDNCSLLTWKSNGVVQSQWKCYLKRRNDALQGKTRVLAPWYPKKHIESEKVTHNHYWRK